MIFHFLKRLMTLNLLLSLTATYAQDLKLQWVRGFTGSGRVGVSKVLADKEQNVYISGYFSGTVDFDLGIGNTSFTADSGFTDGKSFFAKYDPQGNFIFAHPLDANILGFVLDMNDNICLGGTFTSTVDFDPGAGKAQLTSVFPNDVFIAKYDASGTYTKVSQISFSASNSFLLFTMDTASNLFLTGRFTGTVDFDPGIGTFPLTATGSHENVYLVKYNSNGNLDYAFSLNTEYHMSSVVTDKSGNAYICGKFTDTFDLDPGSGTDSFITQGIAAYIGKFDPSGQYIKGFMYNGGLALTMALDDMSNLYVKGFITDSIDIDPGTGVVKLYERDGYKLFLSKYDTDFKFVYGTPFAAAGMNITNGLLINHKNNAYLFGDYKDTANFNTSGGNGKPISNGKEDGYVTRFDAYGKFSDGFSFGNFGYDGAKALCVDKKGNIWLTGVFSETVDFDPRTGIANLTNTMQTGVFLARYIDETALGISDTELTALPVKIYGMENKVIIDFSELKDIHADVQIVNMTGQTIAKTQYTSGEKAQMELLVSGEQVYVVIIRTENNTVTKKIWVR
jgi:hypothetical protein